MRIVVRIVVLSQASNFSSGGTLGTVVLYKGSFMSFWTFVRARVQCSFKFTISFVTNRRQLKVNGRLSIANSYGKSLKHKLG